MTTKLSRARLLGLVIATAATASCSVIPPLPPSELPPTNFPVVEPTLAFDGVDTADGFTPQQRAAVRIRVTTCEGWSNGTGFVVDGNLIITNSHVIDDATTVGITTYDGRDYTATGWKFAPVADIAVVFVDADLPEPVSLAQTSVQLGDYVSSVGYPEGLAQVTVLGVAGVTQSDVVAATGEVVRQFALPSKGGSSGSAIYNQDGEVVSVLYAGDNDKSSLGWDATWLSSLLDGETDWVDRPASC